VACSEVASRGRMCGVRHDAGSLLNYVCPSASGDAGSRVWVGFVARTRTGRSPSHHRLTRQACDRGAVALRPRRLESSPSAVL